ncbi:GTP 3',8-cyclase MoaA [candidate division KSB1 bacterium]|nr:GTP 3',8-cyclase MoaA [candidate division KSB1 bacterium]
MIKDTFNRPVKDLRISVTDRCNFRCPYCMPADLYGEKYTFLPKSDILDFEEVSRLVNIFEGLGVEKVRLTGGEPLMRENVEKLVSMLSGIDGIKDIALTTNGYILHKKAKALKKAGLSRLTISLDSLDDEVFKKLNGREYSVDIVLKAIDKAVKAGFDPLKINAVIQKGINDHTIVDLARHFRGTGHIVRFIEFMDVGTINSWNFEHVVPAGEILGMIDAVFPLEPVEKNYPGEVANRYRYKDGKGEIGIIASVTKPFCGNCTRLRLSTDGRLFTCLFASRGTDIRKPLRDGASDNEIREIIAHTWSNRTDRYSEERTTDKPSKISAKKIEMYQIGG